MINSKIVSVLIVVTISTLLLKVEGQLKHHIVLRSAQDGIDDAANDDWWKTAIFYQIYPRSFMDSNGDGYGDLQGIISRLGHLKDMGISAAWLSPIYKSPGVDQGYDISDYRDIDPMFGNLNDLKLLVKKAHELGIKIIMDFVPNHTSEQHEWFQKSVKNDSKYADYYIWSAGKNGNPPNNWVSEFSDSAWTFNETRKLYYLHQFAWAQPDLNYRNPNVVADMKDILTYWLDFGVDGFRMDAVPFLFENIDLQDEPLSGAPNTTSSQYGYLKHIYTTNLDETYDMIYQFRALLNKYNTNKPYPRIMMTEAYTDLAEQGVAYYGNSTTNGAHFTFNFNLITGLSTGFTVDDVITVVNRWLSHLPKKYISNWVLGNHDQRRVGTRLGVENVDALNMLTAFLPGIQVTYMGEEIGMEDGQVTCEQGFDPQAIKNCSTFAQTSRDFERTPFQWDDSQNAGFSNGTKTWLPVSNKYKDTNLKAQNVAGIKSHYNVYKSMVQFRENFKNISYDAVSLIKLSEKVLQIVRNTNKAGYIYLFNNDKKNQTARIYTNTDGKLKVLVAGVNSQFSTGDVVPNPVTLLPHESLVLQVQQTTNNSGFVSRRSMAGFLLSLLVTLILY